MSPTLTFIDIFGAPGGMSLGFQLAGMQPLGVLDNFKDGIKTYLRNFPKVPEENIVCADASNNGIVEKFQKQTLLKPNDIDVIIGGPPCQGFSTIGRAIIASQARRRTGKSCNARFINDPRNFLYKQFIKFAKHYEPKAVVMENVPGMLSYKNGHIVKQIKKDLHSIGYKNVQCKILNAVNYGVPQFRKRLFFVGTREATITWPEKTHLAKDITNESSDVSKLRKYITVLDAIGDLPRLEIPEKNHRQTNLEATKKYHYTRAKNEFQLWARKNQKTTVSNNITRWHREKDIQVFEHMQPGDKWSDLSTGDKKKIGYHGSDDSFTDRWRRLFINKPSWTIMAHLAKDGYRYIHPTQNRTISVREAARLQSFPDHFLFLGSRGAQFKQIGNAVPPLLAQSIAENLKRILK